MTEKVFSTGDVAKYVGVNFRTVIRWIERGELDGYKLPGRGDHRVTLSSLLAFMNKHQMPIPEELLPIQKKVLVVEDDEPMAKAIARVFKRNGWQVEFAHDGFEAGMALASFNPSLMTLDLKMPYMNGFKVLQLTREKLALKNLKILVISAQPDGDLQMALESGADGVLAKPFENDELLDQVALWFPEK